MPLSRTRTNTGSHLRLLPLALAFLACILAVHAKFTSFTLSSPASQQCQQCIARLTTAPSNLPHAAATIACARLGAVGLECAEEAASELFAIETTLRVQSLGRQYSSHIVDVSQRASLEMFPRFMWGWGPKTKGYCGETSMQAAGLFFGNWFSQQRVRAVARNQEVLINVNAEFAARALWLTHERWDINKVKQPQAAKFLKWAHAHISASAPVLFGVYHRMPGGDPDYDHIVLAHGVSKSAGVVSALHYFDWYLNSSRTLATASPGEPTSDIRSRAQCRQTETPVQPYSYCLPLEYVSALAITGNRDPHSETFRVVLSVGSWSEPDWGAEDKINAAPVLFQPVAVAHGLTAGTSYSMLRFDRGSLVPSKGGFLASGTFAERIDFVARAATYTLDDSELGKIWSNGTYFYRCVANA